MSLSDIQLMSNSGSLRGRILAAAAIDGKDQKWANENLTAICATTGWDTAWAAGVAGGLTYNQDTGVRPDVITDEMIQAAVAARIADEQES
jgi:hypothetical protein